jgi:tRNA/tmRNA/rRNA uracil-C5-methylase (TrmA/RlmC/RlmD family)
MVIFQFYGCISSSKTVDIDSMDVYSIHHEQLLQILDSIVGYEMKYAYYHPDLLFYIRSIPDNYYMIGSTFSAVYKDQNLHECIKYNGHIFLLEGITPDSTIFAKTDRKIPFVYTCRTRRQRLSVPWYTNDFEHRWVYIYKEGEFIFGGGTARLSE